MVGGTDCWTGTTALAVGITVAGAVASVGAAVGETMGTVGRMVGEAVAAADGAPVSVLPG